MRNVLLYTSILLVLITLGTFAWISHNPDSPHLEAAQEWPVVGELARKVREAYLGPSQSETQFAGSEAEAEDEDETENIILDLRGIQSNPAKDVVVYKKPEDLTEQEKQTVDALVKLSEERHGPFGQSASVPEARTDYTPPSLKTKLPVIASEWDWFLPGQPVQAASEPDAEVQDRLSSLSYLPVLFRFGSWVKVRFDGRDGWIDTRWEPPHNRKKARRGILREKESPVRRTDWEDVRKAKRILGVEDPWGEIAGYDVYTDVEDEELLELLAGAAEVAEDAFFARYGRLPSRAPKYALLLFSDYGDYQRYSDETAKITMTGHRGHAGTGLIALTVDGAAKRSAASTMIHEITHILIDRSLSLRVPRWMDEGMASDLGSVWVEDSTDLLMDRLVQDESLTFGAFEARLAHLDHLARRGKLTPLPVVLGRDHEAFYQADVKGESYAQSAAFIRYMLEGDGGAMASGFLTFLDRVAKGRPADLLKLIERDSVQLDAGFRSWIAVEAEKSRESLKRRHGTGRDTKMIFVDR